MSELALKLITENKAAYERGEDATSLNIGNCGLTELPEELFKCVWLEELLVSNVYRDDSNSGWIKSQNEGSENTINVIPDKIGLLTNLRKLQIGGSYREKWSLADIEPLAKLTDLNFLQLYNNKVTDIGPLTVLTGLSTLDLSGNLLTEIGPLATLTTLSSLDLSSNQLMDIGPLAGLRALTSLDLTYNQLTNIEPLAALTELNSLDLSHNQVADIEPLAMLIELRSLDLKGNQLTDVEPLASLTALNTLDLSDNQLTNIGSLTTLTDLNSLKLFNNQLTDVRPLAALTALSSLELSYNQLTDIEPLAALTALSSLQLNSNQIIDIEPLATLIALRSLRLYNNLLRDIRPLAGLRALSSLDLSNNRLTDIRPLAKLATLISVDLRHNRITELPLDLLETLNLELNLGEDSSGIRLFNNPIESPPFDVITQGREFTIEYLKNADKRPLNECKIILIGKGGAGKTTLQKRIMGEPIDLYEPETHGIRKIPWNDGIKSINSEDIKVNFWDFGGQHIQQALHQFFYSKNTVYILVLDRRKEDAPEDFLELVKGYGFNSPVIVVYNNKVKEVEAYNLRPELDSTLLNKYPNIKEVIGINCGRDKDPGVEKLTTYLKNFIPYLEHVREPYPRSWLTIKAQLLDRVGTHYLLYNQYQTICEQHNLQEENIQKSLAEMLAMVGTITYFDRPFDNNYYILNPDWLTTGAYQIILSDHTLRKRGRINRADLQIIFSEKQVFKYKNLDIKILLDLMAAFDLCHKSSYEEEWLIPSSLEGQSKYNLVMFREGGASRYAIRYPVSLPSSVIHRFIVRNIEYAHQEDFWRNGIVVKHPGSNTLMYVEADAKDKEIRLYIKGNMIVECWEFFRKDFKELSEKFEYEELVVLESGEHITYQLLNDAKNAREDFIFIGGKTGRIDVRKTLGLFETKETDDQRHFKNMNKENTFSKSDESQPLKVFISYAHADNEFGQVDLFVKELSRQMPSNKYKIFKDDQIIMGEKWHVRLQKEVDSAAIAILLLSPAFFNSDYISEHELKTFIDNNENKSNILCPVYFDLFDVAEYKEFAKYQFFKPPGSRYGSDYASEKNLCYSHFIKLHPTDGRILPNTARAQYMIDFVKELKKALAAGGIER